jgi:uncharacterized protein (UPF0332 family)
MLKAIKVLLLNLKNYLLKVELPRKTSNWVRDAFNLRQEADYDFEAIITEEEAQILVENAKEFYFITKEYLSKLG